MPEPFVPSGREFDEGKVLKKRSESRLKRGLEKLRKRNTPSRVHDLRTKVPDAVGERLPGAGGDRVSDKPAVDKPAVVEPNVDKPAVKRSDRSAHQLSHKADIATDGQNATTSPPTVSPAYVAAASCIGMDPKAWLTLVCADGDLRSTALQRDLLSALTGDIPPLVGSSIEWLLGFTRPRRNLECPSRLLNGMPAEAAGVFAFVWYLPDPDPLTAYRRAMADIDAAETALRELDRIAERYTTLRPFAHALRKGSLSPNWIQNLGGPTSAAFTECSREINAAIRGHEERKQYANWPRWPDDCQVRLDAPDLAVLWGVSSRVTESPKIVRTVRKVRQEAAANVAANSGRQAQLEDYGIGLASETQSPRRKR